MNPFDVTDELAYGPSLVEALVAQAQEVGRLEERPLRQAEDLDREIGANADLTNRVRRLECENQEATLDEVLEGVKAV